MRSNLPRERTLSSELMSHHITTETKDPMKGRPAPNSTHPSVSCRCSPICVFFLFPPIDVQRSTLWRLAPFCVRLRACACAICVCVLWDEHGACPLCKMCRFIVIKNEADTDIDIGFVAVECRTKRQASGKMSAKRAPRDSSRCRC